jgi:ribosomal-protein-alanine N-acetyltransferase
MLKVNFGDFPVLQTERLLLDRFEPEDAQTFFDLRNHPDVIKYLDRDPDRSVVEVRNLIGKIQQSFDQVDGITWAIRKEAGGKAIGSVGIWRIDKENHRGEIGYLLGPEHWGQGLITEAIAAVMEYGWRIIDLHTMEGNTAVGNAASHAVLMKLGFEKEAHFKQNWHFQGQFLDSVIFCKVNPYH